MNVVEQWQAKWEESLSLWSDFVKLSDPKFLVTAKDEKEEGDFGSFAAIRLADHKIILSVPKIQKYNLEDYPLEIMGHEIGHHVYCPGDLADHGKLIYLIRTAMPRYEHLAPMIVNIYEDLFINDKLKRQHNLRMEEVYQKIGKQNDPFWNFYMRTYEILWALPEDTLTSGKLESNIMSDAILVNRIVRNYSNDWIIGAFDFGNICFPYFIGNQTNSSVSPMNIFHDTKDIGRGSEIPSGITNVDIESVLNEGLDASLGRDKTSEKKDSNLKPNQNITPAQYSAIGEALGIKASISEMAYKYYKERALPYLVTYPSLITPGAPEKILEGTDLWDIGSPIENINWFESLLKGPAVIPGYTTVENFYGEMPSFEIESNPIDLDLFVDCSGSMPNPQTELSYLTLAGTIIALSALRVGSNVRVTLWSGENEYFTTDAFTKNEKSILEILTGYIGGATCFPLDLLKKAYANTTPTKRKTHILIISDEGIDTMYNQKYPVETRSFVKSMLENAGGGGSMVLNLYSPTYHKEIQEMNESGWNIFRISNWEELVEFSRNFVKKTYERNQTLHQTR
ncbi:MAG: VWA domain-containing protein [Leptospira sp.]|nr:VWA domain-containing protein [Leptospira sp.]